MLGCLCMHNRPVVGVDDRLDAGGRGCRGAQRPLQGAIPARVPCWHSRCVAFHMRRSCWRRTRLCHGRWRAPSAQRPGAAAPGEPAAVSTQFGQLDAGMPPNAHPGPIPMPGEVGGSAVHVAPLLLWPLAGGAAPPPPPLVTSVILSSLAPSPLAVAPRQHRRAPFPPSQLPCCPPPCAA